jgi:hypothetical protein
MRAVVVYESMFGNTHRIADAIGEGLRPAYEVVVLPVGDATAEVIAGVDLLVVGGPTHAHGMSHGTTRASAKEMAAKQGLDLDPDAEGQGLRDWFHGVGRLDVARAAAFDTRAHGPAMFTGRASRGITRALERHGASVVADPESFTITGDNHLELGEFERATAWGAMLAGADLTAGAA